MSTWGWFQKSVSFQRLPCQNVNFTAETNMFTAWYKEQFWFLFFLFILCFQLKALALGTWPLCLQGWLWNRWLTEVSELWNTVAFLCGKAHSRSLCFSSGIPVCTSIAPVQDTGSKQTSMGVAKLQNMESRLSGNLGNVSMDTPSKET